jgi:hypothetical protein
MTDPKSSTEAGLRIASEHVHVVYSPKDGQIVHVHRTVVHEGAKAPSEEAAAHRAMDVAKQMGHDVEGLRVLHAKAGELDLRNPQRVDVERQTLIADHSAERRAK